MTLADLKALAAAGFGDLVKAVVDVERQRMAVSGELHADGEAELLADGSRQEHLWGINLYPDRPRAEWLEFDSLINIRPSRGNRSRDVEAPHLREAIRGIVNTWIAA